MNQLQIPLKDYVLCIVCIVASAGVFSVWQDSASAGIFLFCLEFAVFTAVVKEPD